MSVQERIAVATDGFRPRPLGGGITVVVSNEAQMSTAVIDVTVTTPSVMVIVNEGNEVEGP